MVPKREPEMCLNTCTATLWVGGGVVRKLCRNRGGTIFLMPCLGVQHVLTLYFLQPPLDFFLGNMEAVSKEHDECSIRIYREWKKDRAANGTQISWPDVCTGATNRRV